MKIFPNENGFSLVEVIIGLFLIGMIIVVISYLPNTINLVTNSQNETKVREVVAKKLEDVRIGGYSSLENGTTPITDAKLNGLSGFQASQVITDCPLEICVSGELVKKVTMTVSWSENGSPKTFQIVTLISSGGLR